MYKILLTLLLFLPITAQAANLVWKDVTSNFDLTTVGRTKITENGVTSTRTYLVPSAGKSYYVGHTGAGASGDKSLVIDTQPCANGGVLEFYPDTTGATWAATGSAYYCPTGTGATTGAGCARILTDINDVQVGVDEYLFTGDPGLITSDPDGNGLSDNRAWITDIKNPLIFVTWVGSPGANITSIWKYSCPAR